MSRRSGGSRSVRTLVALIAVAAAAVPLLASSRALSSQANATALSDAHAARVTFSPRSSLARLDLRSGNVRRLPVRGFFAAARPSLAPSGRLAFVATTCASCEQHLAVVGGARATRVGPAVSVAWLNDERLLTSAGPGEDTDVWLVGASGRRQEVEWLSDAAEHIDVESKRALTVSPNRRLLAFSGEGPREHHGNYVADLVEHRLLPLPGEGDDAPAFAPDGRTLAYQHVSSRGDWDLCFSRVARGTVSQRHCLPSPGNDREPAFVNGRVLVFASDRMAPRSGVSSLYLLDLRTDALRRLTPPGYDATSPTVGSDGHGVIFVRRSLLPVR